MRWPRHLFHNTPGKDIIRLKVENNMKTVKQMLLLWLAVISISALAETAIEEVIVFSGKAPVELHKADFSVTVATNEYLQQYSLGDLLEVSRVMPNMRIEGTSHSSPQVFVRGFGTNSFNPSFEPAVGIVIDGIYFGRPTHLSESVFDLNQIELLRGPQGTLFGKNTIAGVLNITTHDAIHQSREGYLSYKDQDYGDKRLELAANHSSGNIALRLAGLKWTRQGRVYNTLLERKEDTREQYAWRLHTNWQLKSQSDLGIKYQRSSASYNFWPRQLMLLDNDTRDYLEAFDPKIEDDPTNFQTSFDMPGRMHIDSQTLALSWERSGLRFPGAIDSTMSFRTAVNELDFWQYQDIDVSPAELIDLDESDFYRQTSAELGVSLDYASLFGLGKELNWVMGAYYFLSDFDIDLDVIVGRDVSSFAGTADAQQLVTGNGSRPFIIDGALANYFIQNPLPEDDHYLIDFGQSTESIALYTRIALSLTEKLQVISGARYTRERKLSNAIGSAACTTEVIDGSCISQIAIGTRNYRSGNIHKLENHLMPRLSIRYDSSANTSWHISSTLGFKSGGVNAISYQGIDLEFAAEENWTNEMGVRSQLFNNKWKLAVTAFHSRFDNLQVMAFNGLFFDVTNAAKATSYGLEFESDYKSTWPALQFKSSAGWLIARYDRYKNAPAPIYRGSGERQDLSGKKIAYSPEVTITLAPTLRFSSDSFQWGISALARYQASHYTDTDLDRNTKVDSATLFDVSIFLSHPGSGLKIQLGGKNLTDVRRPNQVLDTALFPGTYNTTQHPGREIYTTLRWSW